MPVDVVGALLGWVVSLVGDALVRRSADARALSRALELAMERVVQQTDSLSRDALRLGLRECFSGPPRLGLDARTSVNVGLRRAIEAQVDQLDQMVHGDTGQPFYRVVAVDREWLVDQVTVAIVTALRQVVAGGGLAELVQAVNAGEVLARLDTLGVRVSELTVSASTAAAMQTLPRDIGSFTGRHRELQRLMAVVAGRAVTGGVVSIHAIDGMAGIGKTALAVHAAHQLAPHFPDGQIFLRLHGHTPGQRPVDPAEALATLLLSSGIAPQQIPADLQARELLWRDRLSNKKVLLVLDDAAEQAQVDPLLPGTGESLVVITSRRRLAALDDAVSISLDILAPEDAAALFLRVADRPDLQLTEPGVAEMTRLCGYLPLAIRLVVGRLGKSTWTITEVAAELAAVQDRLPAIEAGQRSVTAAFDLSYRDLTMTQQQMFRRLGLQLGVDIDAYAAAALSDTTLPTARRRLEDLCDLSLLEAPVRGRYRLHDLLRDYARTLAERDPLPERDAALDRLLDYYLHTATAAAQFFRRTPAPPMGQQPSATPELATHDAAVAWLETERANLRAATDYAALHARDVHAIHLPAAMHEFLRAKGPWGQALILNQTALGATRRAGDRVAEARALNNMGEVQRLIGHYLAACVSLEQALALYRELGEGLGEADTLTILSDVQRLIGDYPVACASLQQALVLYRDLGDRLGEADTLTTLGFAQCPTDYPAATANLHEALGLTATTVTGSAKPKPSRR